MCPCMLPLCLKIPLKPGLVPSARFDPAQSSLSYTSVIPSGGRRIWVEIFLWVPLGHPALVNSSPVGAAQTPE